jgi:nucleotide-binding universal stress UspA family protein
MHDGPVLFAYDGSDDADRAIEVAFDLLGAGPAIVLDVGPVLTTAESLAAISSVVPGGAFDDLNLDDALARVRPGAEHARQVGFDAEPRAVLTTPTWEGIVDTANEIDAKVIVVGSRGLTGAKEAFEGSVSHQVAEHAGRPVLIVAPAR